MLYDYINVFIISAILVYYNEIDPFAAAWLRELIAHGVIANGIVDERSIVEVQPDDLKEYTQCHFFAGIGVWSYALRQAGWTDDRPVWTGSCPCQPFSTAGKRKGSEDERHLWPEFRRLISECRPVTVFGEQVAPSATPASRSPACTRTCASCAHTGSFPVPNSKNATCCFCACRTAN